MAFCTIKDMEGKPIFVNFDNIIIIEPATWSTDWDGNDNFSGSQITFNFSDQGCGPYRIYSQTPPEQIGTPWVQL